MARQDALSIYINATTKDKLVEVYGEVLEAVQLGAVSEQIKNKNYSGDPESGSVEIDRFKNAAVQETSQETSQPTSQEGKTKKTNVALIVIIVLLPVIILVVIFTVGLTTFIFNTASATLDEEIIKKETKEETEKEIDNIFNSDTEFENTTDLISSTTGDTLKDENTAYPWINDFNIEFGEFTAIKNDYFYDTKLEVVVMNKTNEKKSFIIYVNAIRPDRSVVEKDIILIDNLDAGEKTKVEIFNYLNSSIIEDMKKAKFEVSGFAVE